MIKQKKIKCKKCGYEGKTTVFKKFGRVTRYVCPKCLSREIVYR